MTGCFGLAVTSLMLLGAAGTSAAAQLILGARAGLTLTTLSGDDIKDVDSRSGRPREPP